MKSMTAEECIEAIRRQETFHASVDNEAFFIKVEDYTHFVCTAIHSGHRMRAGLAGNCILTEAERLYEEDPFTDTLIDNLPITVIANDSRFEYDLNRAPEKCVYVEAWGKPVWREPLTEEEMTRSLDKHATFYRVLGALYDELEALHPAVLTYDVHSYNYQRPGMGDTPVFNVGTEQIDRSRWQAAIEHWARILDGIRLPGIPVRCAINEVFFGRGYHATFVRESQRNTLILPSEVKKVFMDEHTGQPHPAILESLHAEFERAVRKNSYEFTTTDH